MAMGVPYDEYWNGDYTQLPFYRKAYDLKRKEKNQELWLSGLYTLRAIASVMPKSELHYPEEPLPLTEEDMLDMEERKKKAEIEAAKTYLQTMMHNINKQRREKGGLEHGGKRTDSGDRV